MTKSNSKIQDLIVQFDSSTALMKSLSLCLMRKEFKGVGVFKHENRVIAHLINSVPKTLRKGLYSWSGWLDAAAPDDARKISSAELSEWSLNYFKESSYPGVMYGSSNGAAVHLAAALGVPWIPQTYLFAVQRMMRPDAVNEDIEWGKKVIQPLLKKCPDLHAAQMHDPVQDRLMVSKMGYFRLKKLKLDRPLKNFLKKHLSPEHPLISIECNYLWPAYKAGDRHSFQLGGFGAMDPYEYLNGSRKVSRFLKRCDAPVRRWKTFRPDGEYPEAEWGFYRKILPDLREAAKKKRAVLHRFVFDHPEGMSEFTGDLYRWWYRKNGIHSKTMLVENFGLLAPYRTIISGSIPFWLAFNTDSSADRLKSYLHQNESLERLYLMLMSNGVAEGIGLTPIRKWQSIIRQNACESGIIGVNEREYPLDFGNYIKYHVDLRKKLKKKFPVPERLTMEDVKKFMKTSRRKYPLKIISRNYGT